MLDVSDLPTATCFAIAGCTLNYKTGAAVYCASDILDAYTSGAAGLFSTLSGMSAYMSTITMKAIRTISLLRVYWAMAVLSIAMLATHFIITFLFFYEHWQAIVLSLIHI